MLYTKPQGHWPFGSVEEDFNGFLTYMGLAAILVMWPIPPSNKLRSPDPWRLHMNFDFDWSNGFGEEDI